MLSIMCRRSHFIWWFRKGRRKSHQGGNLCTIPSERTLVEL